jgi:hypothetical protein
MSDTLEWSRDSEDMIAFVEARISDRLDSISAGCEGAGLTVDQALAEGWHWVTAELAEVRSWRALMALADPSAQDGLDYGGQWILAGICLAFAWHRDYRPEWVPTDESPAPLPSCRECASSPGSDHHLHSQIGTPR